MSGTKKIFIALLLSGILIAIFVLMIVYNQQPEKSKTTVLPTGVEYTIIKESTKPQTLGKGDTVSFYYTGKLENGTVFETNVGSKPFTRIFVDDSLIPGMLDGMTGMKIGEKRSIKIPPDQGYGQEEAGSIPANSTIIFEVEVVDIISKVQ